MYDKTTIGIPEQNYKDYKKQLKEQRRRKRYLKKRQRDRERKRNQDDDYYPIYDEETTKRGIEAGLEFNQLFRKRRERQ